MDDHSPSETGTVLVVDDDSTSRVLIGRSLEDAGFEVWPAACAEEALHHIDKRGIPHLAVVDIRMPGMSGIELGQKILEFVDLPLIMVTAVDDDETVIQTIESLAEDYVRKPFLPGELVARVRRLLRRIGSFDYVQGAVSRLDEHLSVAFQHRMLIIDGREIELTPTETKLLYLLIRANGRILTTAYLLDRLWPSEDVFEDSLRSHVYRLRRKMESAFSASQLRPRKYLKTQRGIGYRFAIPSD